MCKANKKNKKIKVGAVQFDPKAQDVDFNIKKALSLLNELKRCDIAILPEYWSCSWCYDCMESVSQFRGECIGAVSQWAADTKTWLLAGTVPFKAAEGIYNRAYLIDAQGKEAAFYDKMHLFAQGGEAEVFLSGSTPLIFEALSTTFGITVCHDLRFGEYHRKLAMYGAQVILCPAMWPAARINAWRVLGQARAMDHQVFWIGVNSQGSSLAVDPYGDIVAQLGEGEGIFIADIALNEVEKARAKMSLNKTRRPDIYGFPEEEI